MISFPPFLVVTSKPLTFYVLRSCERYSLSHPKVIRKQDIIVYTLEVQLYQCIKFMGRFAKIYLVCDSVDQTVLCQSCKSKLKVSCCSKRIMQPFSSSHTCSSSKSGETQVP